MILLIPDTSPDEEFEKPDDPVQVGGIICQLRNSPINTIPLLELKPIEGGDGQRTFVLSEKSGIELRKNPIPGVQSPP